jgi:deoxyribonucleoside regulator
MFIYIMMITEDQHNFIYKIALAYYQHGLTQQEIATRYAVSRPKISRLLQKARDEGIVNITLVPPVNRYVDVERRLEDKYQIDEVLTVPVEPTWDAHTIARTLGPVAAGSLLRTMNGSEIVGFAWGKTILSMVNALPTRNWPNATIVQITGGLGHADASEHSAELTRRVAQKFNAKLRLLQAPGIVTTQTIADALLLEPQIAETLALAARADIAVVGLGVPTADSVVRRDGLLLNSRDLQNLENAGAAGDIALRYITADGQPVSVEINDRILGLSLKQIHGIKRVIGVAGGEEKYHIILAALRGHHINVLVTDDITAHRLLEESPYDAEL